MLECKIQGCSKKIFARGFCCTHYHRLRKHGDPLVLSYNRSGITKQYPNEYRAWQLMKRRCYNKNDDSYSNYGGRGIKVCDRWLERCEGFSNFLSDMGVKPSSGGNAWSLDRIGPDGDYCPENCRWANWHTQAINRRNTRHNKLSNITEWEGGYRVQITHNRQLYSKMWRTLEDAICDRDSKIQKWFGEI